MVEVVARNHDHQEIAVPVANLKSCQPMVSFPARPGGEVGDEGEGEELRSGELTHHKMEQPGLHPCLLPAEFG